MFLILGEAEDHAAVWVAERLQARGVETLYVTPLELLSAVRWHGRVGDGAVCFDVDLCDGREIRFDCVRGALNRISALPPALLDAVDPADHEYVANEFFALLLAFLEALPGPLINPPTPRWLAGPMGHPIEWAHLACRAGLSPAQHRWSVDAPAPSQAAPDIFTAIVLDGFVAPGDVSPELAQGCRALAKIANAPLLQISLAATARGPAFLGASSMADLRLGGEPLIDHLVDMLGADGRGPT